MSQRVVERFRENIRSVCVRGKQADLAKDAGISAVYLNRILRGKSIPSLTIAEDIAVAAGLTLSQAISFGNSKKS